MDQDDKKRGTFEKFSDDSKIFIFSVIMTYL